MRACENFLHLTMRANTKRTLRARAWANSPILSIQPLQEEDANAPGDPTTTRAQNMRRRSDALKALRSALVSRIYQSGFVGGMTVRVIRFESLSSVESVELNIWQPVKTDTSPRADPNEATGGVEHDTDGTDAAAVPQVPCTKDVQVSDAAGGEINTEQEAREGREAGSDEQAAGSAEAGASEGSASADEGVAKAKEVTYERMTMEAKSFALVQLSWTAETKMESFREAGKAMDFPHAGASAKEICKWIKNRETLSARGDAVRNPLYGSLVVNASPIANDNLFLVVSMAVNLQDGLKLTDEEFKDNLRQDVATAQAAATGMDVSQIAVLVVKMDPRRNYAVLELKDKKEQKKLQRTSSFQRTSSLENKMQRHETLTLLHKLQDGNLCPHAHKWILSAVTMRGHLPPLMPGERAGIKLFNSSTFSDMHCERDLLNAAVYPALRSMCLHRRIDFSWIDFRWGGVTAADTSNNLGVIRCLQKIEECSLPLQTGVVLPLVVATMGERGGWIPGPDSQELVCVAPCPRCIAFRMLDLAHCDDRKLACQRERVRACFEEGMPLMCLGSHMHTGNYCKAIPLGAPKQARRGGRRGCGLPPSRRLQQVLGHWTGNGVSALSIPACRRMLLFHA
jgi:hypothetical protein